jgi:hypothetical protein
MTRFAVRAALAAAVTAGAIVGCQPAKEIPDALPKSIEPDLPPAVPPAPDAAAKAYIEKAVKAFTGNKPELLAKGKVSRAVFKGRRHVLNQPAGEVARTVAAVWPDRFTDTDVIQAPDGNATVSAYLRRPNFAVFRNGTENPLPNAVEWERNFAADETAQFWMALLLPVTDPKAILFEFQSTTGTAPQTGASMPIHLMKVALGDLPVFQLTFDAKTDLLGRVEYTVTELGVRYQRVWTALGHKPGPDGLVVPTKIEFIQDSRMAEQFDVDKWEFPASIPDTEFDPPKK